MHVGLCHVLEYLVEEGAVAAWLIEVVSKLGWWVVEQSY